MVPLCGRGSPLYKPIQSFPPFSGGKPYIKYMIYGTLMIAASDNSGTVMASNSHGRGPSTPVGAINSPRSNTARARSNGPTFFHHLNHPSLPFSQIPHFSCHGAGGGHNAPYSRKDTRPSPLLRTTTWSHGPRVSNMPHVQIALDLSRFGTGEVKEDMLRRKWTCLCQTN